MPFTFFGRQSREVEQKGGGLGEILAGSDPGSLRRVGRQARVTSPPDFLQLHNPQPIITHHHPTAPAAVYQKAIVTTMNYNCADLQHDLALSVITQLPQHRAAEAPVLVKWNNFCEEKEGKYSVSGKLCSADCVLVSLRICL